jgi:hypothetical protein
MAPPAANLSSKAASATVPPRRGMAALAVLLAILIA